MAIFLVGYFLSGFAADLAPAAGLDPAAALAPGAAAACALLGARRLRRPWASAFTDGRTITRPPSDPGTAPLINRRLRGTSISTILRFSMVRLRTPMWPDMRLPLNTRPGVWRCPMEPGARCDTELP